MKLSMITLILLLAATISCSKLPKVEWKRIDFALYKSDIGHSISLWDREADKDIDKRDLLGCLSVRDIITLRAIHSGIKKVWERIDFEFYESFDGTRYNLVPYTRSKDTSKNDVYGCLILKDVEMLKNIRNFTNK